MNVDENDMPIKKETTAMKHSKADVRGKARPALEVRFEPQHLTSYSGLILFQHFFSLIGLKERLWGCFRHLTSKPIYMRISAERDHPFRRTVTDRFG